MRMIDVSPKKLICNKMKSPQIGDDMTAMLYISVMIRFSSFESNSLSVIYDMMLWDRPSSLPPPTGTTHHWPDTSIKDTTNRAVLSGTHFRLELNEG